MRQLRAIPLISVLLIGCDPPPLTPNGVVNVFGRQGMGPGEFGYPRAIAASPDGKIFVVDKTGRIQRFDATGHCETGWMMPDWIAGKPVGLTVHPDGRLFVPDTHYHRVIVFDPDGHELARFGREGTGPGEFLLPTDIAFDAAGFVYVAEYNGNDRVTKWTPQLQFDSVVIAGDIASQPMRRPAAVVFDHDRTMWIADSCNHRILHFDPTGRLLSQFGEMGAEPGQMRYPYDLDLTPEGQLLVCEYGNSRMQWFDRAGKSLRLWGEPGREVGQLNSPWGATIGANGLIYIADSLNARVQVVRP